MTTPTPRELDAAEIAAIRENAEQDDTYLTLQERIDRLEAMAEDKPDSGGLNYFLAKAHRNIEAHPSTAILALLAHVAAVDARCRAYEAALRPFAEFAEVVITHRDPLPDDRAYLGIDEKRITYGDLRRAFAALAANDGSARAGSDGDGSGEAG